MQWYSVNIFWWYFADNVFFLDRCGITREEEGVLSAVVVVQVNVNTKHSPLIGGWHRSTDLWLVVSITQFSRGRGTRLSSCSASSPPRTRWSPTATTSWRSKLTQKNSLNDISTVDNRLIIQNDNLCGRLCPDLLYIISFFSTVDGGFGITSPSSIVNATASSPGVRLRIVTASGEDIR